MSHAEQDHGEEKEEICPECEQPIAECTCYPDDWEPLEAA